MTAQCAGPSVTPLARSEFVTRCVRFQSREIEQVAFLVDAHVVQLQLTIG